MTITCLTTELVRGMGPMFNLRTELFCISTFGRLLQRTAVCDIIVKNRPMCLGYSFVSLILLNFYEWLKANFKVNWKKDQFVKKLKAIFLQTWRMKTLNTYISQPTECAEFNLNWGDSMPNAIGSEAYVSMIPSPEIRFFCCCCWPAFTFRKWCMTLQWKP